MMLGSYDSAMVSALQKAIFYSHELDRLQANPEGNGLILRGKHHTHDLYQRGGVWTCTCEMFAQRRVCSHTMTLERLANQENSVLARLLTALSLPSVSEPSDSLLPPTFVGSS